VIPTESGTLAVDGSMIEAAIQMAKLDQEIAALETSWASAGTAKQPRAASPGASSPAPGGRNQTNSHELGVHLSDLDWKRGPLSRLIEIAGDPMETAGDLKKGSVVTCEVTEVKELCEVYWRNYLANDTHPEWVATEKKDAGIDVKIVGSDLTTFIKCSELGRDRDDQRPERFAVGQKVDALVTQFDRRTHKVQVSLKALEVAEEKEAIAQYGSADSGATTNSTATIK